MKRVAMGLLAFVISCGDNGGGSGPNDLSSASDLSGGGGPDLSTDDVGSSPDLTVTPPATTIPSTEIKLGPAACGGSAPADQLLAFTNSGGMPLTYTATIPVGGTFSLAGADSTGTVAGTLQPGDNAMLTIHGSTVPSSTAAGTKLTGVLTVITNVPNSAPMQIPLSEVASGGQLTLMPAVTASNPANANFGMSPFGQAATPIPLTLTNIGNATVGITITQPNDSQFMLSGASGTLTLAAAASVPSLSASFTPSSYTQSNASSIIVVTSGAICGASANLITFQGQGSGAAVMSTPGSGTTLDFGSTNCGATGLTGKLVTISNGGNVAYVYQATLGQAASSPFTINGTSSATGTLAASGGTTSLTIAPKNVSQMTAPGTLSDVLTIAPQAGQSGPTLTLNLTLTVTGAMLGWQIVPSPYTNVSAGGSQSQLVTVVNSGNLPASPSLSISAQSKSGVFAVSTALSGPITSSMIGSGAVSFSPPQGDFSTETAQLNLVAGGSDVICGNLPAAVGLSGTGLAGGFGVNPSSLSFGNAGMVPCQTTASPMMFTLTNNGNADYTWTASLGRTPSPFMLSATSGTVTKGGQQMITVTPLALPFPASTAPNAYGDTVTISTNIDSTLHTITLNQTAQGALLDWSTPSISFGGVPLGQTSTQQFDVVNSGNAPGNVTLADARTSGPTDATYQVNSAAMVTLSGLSGSQPITASFAPGATAGTDAQSSTANVHMTVDSSTVLCAALPADLSESGSGQGAQVLIQPASQLTFTGPAANGLPQPPPGDTYCGTQATAQQITVTNTGTVNFDITAIAFGLMGSSPYTYSLPGGAALPATVPPNMSVVITVSSSAAPSTFTFPGNLNDTITITTNAAGDTPTTINLVQSPYGAVLQSWTPTPASGTSTVAFGDVAIGGTKSINLGVTNSGNAPATIQFLSIMSTPASTAFSFTQNAVVPANNGALPSGGQAFAASFSPPTGTTAGTAYTGSATVATTATPLCGPLPATAMSMSGKAVNAPLWTAVPNPIGFDVFCGAGAGAQKKTVTIVNSSQDPTTITGWTAAVSNVSPAGFTFQLSKSSGGSIAPGANDTFDIETAAVPQDPNIFNTYSSITATLTITVTGGVMPTSIQIPVTQNLFGLGLSFKPTSITFPSLLGSTPFTVTNSGNVPVASPNFEIKMSYTGGSPAFNMSIAGAATKTLDIQTGITAGGSVKVNVFDNSSPAGSKASIDVASTGGVASCWPIPSPAVSVSK
jgi:hypothetical protein